jgi:hypothetical protein
VDALVAVNAHAAKEVAAVVFNTDAWKLTADGGGSR